MDDNEFLKGKDSNNQSKPLLESLRERGVRIMTPEEEQAFFEQQRGVVSVILVPKQRKR